MAKKTSQPTSSPEPDKKAAAAKRSKLEPRISNRRALFDFFVIEKVECGIELVGSEVKSIRLGKVQLGQSFARIRNGQVQLHGCHIDEYVQANAFNHDPTRTRRLLLHRREIRKLEHRLQKERGTTLIPLEIYFKRGFAKVRLGLAKGKKVFDKRAAIKERDDKRNMEKATRRR
jgi:SsrA-binding protein